MAKGLAKDWEELKPVRDLLLNTGRLIQPDPSIGQISDTVECVAINAPVLEPLMPRLWVETEPNHGYVDIVTIPSIEVELLAFDLLCMFLLPILFI